VSLVVLARVRSPLNVVPTDLNLGGVGTDSVKESHFEVQNFSEEIWQGIEVHSSGKWMSASVTPIHVERKLVPEGQPRQVWRVIVQSSRDGLRAGPHRGSLSPLGQWGQRTNLDARLRCG
jgi:hypothetical protein